MKIGLYFGTFNPIHIGHLIIANHMAEHTDLDQVWMVVTPHNPLKNKSNLLSDHHRLEMVYQATKQYPKLKPSDVEFKLSQPNYTVITLAHIQEKYPQHTFCLLMGQDNLQTFHKWKNYEVILAHHQIYVYPRISSENAPSQFDTHPKVTHIQAPIIELSSTFIREQIKTGKNVTPMLPELVWQYIDHNNLYKK